jgi:quercetin dioxygenase-like cupin family protein
VKDELILRANEGRRVQLGGLGVRFLVDGEATGGRFALVEHPLDPRALAGPIHTHANEDEIMTVVEGEVGARIGDDELVARPGDVVFKPRGVPHTFWNAGDEPARVLELITPAGFERYFEEIAAVIPEEGPPDIQAIAAVQARYSLTMDLASVPELVERHGVVAPGAPPARARRTA